MSIILDFESARFVYFAVPKVANTSLRDWLLPLVPDAPVGAVHNIHQDVDWPRLSRAAFLECRKAPEFLSFALVRNPWERLVSTYRDKVLRDRIHPPLGKLGFEARMPFLDFVERVVEIPDRDADPHIRSQWAFLGQGPHLLPDLVLDIREIGKLVRILRSWSPESVGQLPDPRHLNSSPMPAAVPEFLETTAKRNAYAGMIEGRYKREILTFGYKFPY